MMGKNIIVIGAGPAGLTAGYLLAQANIPVTVLEADANYVGGIARTVKYKGYHFDIGGHRFFSKSKEIEDFWTEILPDDMLIRPRTSRIFYNQQFFAYPLNVGEVLRKLGIWESGLCCLSYLKAKLFPIKNVVSFADWVTNHFGARLFSIFFKTYTEKVWGIPCNQISADWAAQRIHGLSFFTVIINALKPKRWQQNKRSQQIKTLIDAFRYPRQGPGMLWQACADKMVAQGGKLQLGQRVADCTYDAVTGLWRVTAVNAQGERVVYTATDVISTAPLRELVTDYLAAQVPLAVREAALHLQYRDFLIVALIVKEKNVFSDNWIYIHDAAVTVGRIQNFKSWSPDMVPDPTTACYGLEYFCFAGDTLWSASDADLLAKAKQELIQIGLTQATDILDGCVVRQKKAYPVYDAHYQTNVDLIRAALASQFPGLHIIGRNGMHKYNNQDHAMMTAMLTVKNILAGKILYDVWEVNQDAAYHEAGVAGTQTSFGMHPTPEQLS